MATKKQPAKPSTNVNVSLRIDPKTKYLIDLLARDQKRTITGVIEWAIERAAAQERFDNNSNTFYDEVIDDLWSTDESIRLITLALSKPSLLDYDQTRIWETIQASPDFWRIRDPGGAPRLYKEWIDGPMIQAYWEPLVDHVQKHRHSPSVRPFSLEEHGVKREELEKRKVKQPKDPGAPLDPFDPEIPY